VISLSEIQVQKCGLSTYLEQSLAQLSTYFGLYLDGSLVVLWSN